MEVLFDTINISRNTKKYILSRFRVKYKTGLNWRTRFIAPYTLTQLGTTDNTTLSLFYTLSVHRCTRTRVLSSPVISRQRIYHSLTHDFKLHTKSSCHNLIPFLPLFSNCQLNSIPSSSPGRLASKNSTPHSRLDYSLYSTAPLYYFVPSSDYVLV
jgi:hypothetical protein